LGEPLDFARTIVVKVVLAVSCLLVAPLARAQGLVAAVVDSNGPSEATARKAQKALDAALKSLSGAPVAEGPAFKKGAPKKCEGAECARALVASLDVPAVALLDLKGSDTRVVFELSFWLDGERQGARKGETPPDALEPSMKAAAEQVLPGWLRKGFGAMAVQVEGGSVVKVDGRVVAARNGELVAVPSGAHQVDVVFPSGDAVLQRLEVPEAGRVALAVEPQAALTARAAKGPTALRYGSYGLVMLGAASAAAGFVAGALSKGTAVGLTRCDTPEARDCSSLAEVLRANQQAQQYASFGNLLLILGAASAALGVSLFVVDALLP
jgi:hypothetical protein